MALAQTKSKLQLQKMTFNELFDYFLDHASYHKGGGEYEYAIQVGPRTLFASDTMKLRRKFTRLVKKG